MLRYLFAVTISALAYRSAVAAEFAPVWLKTVEPRALIIVQGEIVPGDPQRLLNTMNSLFHERPGGKVLALDLNTPGGDVSAGMGLATIIVANGLDTVLYPGATCASACAMMFFAGSHKYIGAGARVGVHRAATGTGVENDGTIASSVTMARLLAGMGASSIVTHKLMATPSSGIAWLNPEDLAGIRGLKYAPAPKSSPSDEFQRGWDDAKRSGARSCPGDMSGYADGCRAAVGR